MKDQNPKLHIDSLYNKNYESKRSKSPIPRASSPIYGNFLTKNA